MDQEIKTVIQYPTGSTEFDIPFDYLSRRFVRVSLVSEDSRKLLSNITEYRYVSKTRIKLLVSTEGFDRVEIRRFTSASERIVDFNDGSVLRATDLNVSQLQSAHIAEEARDAALLAMPQDDAGNLDARSRRIVNLAPGIDGTDAINKDQLDSTLGEAGGILSDMKEVQKETYDYIEKLGDDTSIVRGVTWVYNQGSAVGGETTVLIDKPTRTLAVPYIEINGSRQEVGYHFSFDIATQMITLTEPLVAGDFLMAMTTESSVPLEDLLANPTGASAIGTSDGRNVQANIDELRSELDFLKDTTVLDVRRFGAVGDGIADDYPAFQKACIAASQLGGAIVHVPTPKVKWKIGFPVYLFDRTWVRGTGINCIVEFTDPLYARKSRSGFVIGSGYEQNRDKAIQCLNDGTWATTGSVVDRNFVELDRGQYVRDNPSKVQSRLCRVSGMYLKASYPNGATLKGGYAVSGANAVDSEVFDIWGEGWTEIINFGSDVPPATPSCHNLHAYDITCVAPNDYETYYSAGFIANSTSCSIGRFKQLRAIADGSPHGSCGSTNYTEFCSFYDIDVPNLGRTASSEGILVNNSKGAVTRNIRIGNAKTCVAEYYTTGAGIFYDRNHPNVFDGIHANNCDNAVALRSKFSVWKNVTQTNCTYHVYFGTTNAQACVVKFVPDTIGGGNNVDILDRLRDNVVSGWRVRSLHIRPIAYLLNDKSVLRSWDAGKNIKAENGVGFQWLFPVPSTMRAITQVSQWFTFEVGAATAGTEVKVQVRRMSAYNGDANEQPVILFENSRKASLDTVQATNIVANSPGLVLTSPTDGLANAVDVLVSVTAPTVNFNMKEARITYLGD